MSLPVFFFGLFMAPEQRPQIGDCGSRERALVADHALVVAGRATLVPRAAHRAWGMLETLSPSAVAALYSAPGLDRYFPIQVRCVSLDQGRSVDAEAWIAPPDREDELNLDYAARLIACLKSCGLPPVAWRALERRLRQARQSG